MLTHLVEARRNEDLPVAVPDAEGVFGENRLQAKAVGLRSAHPGTAPDILGPRIQ